MQFGAVTLDIDGRRVHLDGEPQHLEPQAFDLLAFLFAERQRVVPKHEIFDAVWGDQFVSDAALTTRIKEVRRAVGDDGSRQQVIKNVRGRGYRFIAELQPDAAAQRRGTPASSLVGRGDDLAAAVALLETDWLLTLVGPGGVGKTTLALEIGRVRGDRHRDGVFVVRLGRLRDPHEVVHALRLDLELAHAGTDETSLVSAVAALDALVVLDNCEHVIDEVARLVAAIDERGGDVAIVATSRERLGVASERVQPVAPLAVAPAVELLRTSVERINSAYVWPDDDDSIRRLLEMVDHLPLGIEMAAARLPMFGPRELVEHLADGLDLLQSPTRGREARHQTLRALVEWSLPLLSPDANSLLVTVSAFAGPARLDDIAAVAPVDQQVRGLGSLAELIEHSLIVTDTSHVPTRYRLLDTVRAVVAPQRSADLESRHAAWVVEVAAEADRGLRTIDEATAAVRLDELVADARVAHRWARQHHPELATELTAALLLYAQERQWPEVAEWSTGLVADPSCASAHHAAVAADAANRGRLVDARVHAERAVHSTDLRVRASALDTLANLGLYEGDLDEVHVHGAALRDLGRSHDDPFIWMLGANSSSLAWAYAGDVERARATLRDDRPIGDLAPTIRAWLDYADAEAALAAGDVDDALVAVERAIRVGESVRSGFVVSVAQVTRLSALSKAGDVDAAVAAFVPALRQYRFTHDVTHVVTALRNVVVLLARLERDQVACELLGALDTSAGSDSYGDELADLAEARRTMEQRNGSAAVATWIATGSGQSVRWAVEHALAALDAAH